MPVIERELQNLKEQGFTDIIITVSHLGNIIIDYFGDGSKISPVTGESFGLNIKYFFEETPLGTAGALFKLKDELKDDFLLLNGDAIFDIDFNRFVNYHKQKGGLVTLFTHPNSHPYDSGLIITENDGSVKEWLSKEENRPKYYKNRVNAGLHVISPEVLKMNINTEKVDLDRQILKPLCKTGKVYAYDSPEYVKDMGTPDRYYLVQDNKRKIEQDVYDKILKDEKYGKELADSLQGALPTISLNNHESLNTAFLNDVNPCATFSQQVIGYGVKNDVFLGISTSGNSKNVVMAAITAKAKGLKVISLTGQKESDLSRLSDVTIRVPETETYKIQEYHLPVYHALCLMLEEKFFE